MTIFIIIAIAIYMVSLSWVWKNLGNIEKNKKIIFIAIGVVAVYLITLLIFSISKNGVIYKTIEIQKIVRNVLVLIFSSLNSIIILPYLANLVEKIYEDEIEKQEFSKKIIIFLVILIICAIIETKYLKNMSL